MTDLKWVKIRHSGCFAVRIGGWFPLGQAGGGFLRDRKCGYRGVDVSALGAMAKMAPK